jgi:hypothetical protein
MLRKTQNPQIPQCLRMDLSFHGMRFNFHNIERVDAIIEVNGSRESILKQEEAYLKFFRNHKMSGRRYYQASQDVER